LVLGPAAAFFDFAPGVHQIYPAIFVLSLLSLAFAWRARPALRVAVDGLGLLPFLLLMPTGQYLVPLDASLRPLARIVNRSISIGLVVSLCIIGTMLAWHAFQYFRSRNQPAPAAWIGPR
jgi:hypothetical protein